MSRLTVLLAAATVLGACAGCGPREAHAKRDVPVPVIAETATTQPITDYVDTVGSVEPEVTSKVGSQLPGRIVLMTKDVGDLVYGQCGDPAKDKQALLARLDTDALEAQAKRLDAEIKLAEVNLSLAEKDWTRAEQLFKQGSIPENKRDEAKSAFDAAAARAESVRAARKEAEVQIGQSSIYSPIDAVIVRKFANVGDVVSPMFSPQLYQLECIRDLKINLIVPERDEPAVRARKRAEIAFDALPGHNFAGEIHTVIPSGDPVAHSFIAEIRFRNYTKDGPLPQALPPGLTPGDLLIKPGMFARVKIVKYEKNKATVVPRQCVVEEDAKAFVYVIENGRAKKTPVETGVVMGGLIEIVKGIEPGVTLVGRGIENVTEGQPVRVMNESSVSSKQ